MGQSVINSLPLVKIFAALVGLAFSLWSDLKNKTVSNKTNLIIFGVGLLFCLIEGPSQWMDFAISFLTAAAFALPAYYMKIFGGGDTKLFLALSPFLSGGGVLEVFVASVIWGAILGLILVISKSKLSDFIVNLKMLLLKQRPIEQNLHRMPFSVAITFGFLTHLVLQGAL
jgi:Flp pilus assembly protein protease CpaA